MSSVKERKVPPINFLFKGTVVSNIFDVTNTDVYEEPDFNTKSLQVKLWFLLIPGSIKYKVPVQYINNDHS